MERPWSWQIACVLVLFFFFRLADWNISPGWVLNFVLQPNACNIFSYKFFLKTQFQLVKIAAQNINIRLSNISSNDNRKIYITHNIEWNERLQLLCPSVFYTKLLWTQILALQILLSSESCSEPLLAVGCCWAGHLAGLVLLLPLGCYCGLFMEESHWRAQLMWECCSKKDAFDITWMV